MAHVILSHAGAVRAAAEMAAEGQDTRFLAEEQSAYRDDIKAVTRLVWEEGMAVEEAIEQVLGG